MAGAIIYYTFRIWIIGLHIRADDLALFLLGLPLGQYRRAVKMVRKNTEEAAKHPKAARELKAAAKTKTENARKAR